MSGGALIQKRGTLLQSIAIQQSWNSAREKSLAPLKLRYAATQSPMLGRMIQSRQASIRIFYFPHAPMFPVPDLEQFVSGDILVGYVDIERA